MIPGIVAGGRIGEPPATAPQLLDQISQGFSTPTTPHNVSMPATVNAGDLLVVACSNNGSAAGSMVTTPAGWTAFGTERDSSNACRVSLFYKIAAGSEGGGTVNFATASGTSMVTFLWRWQVSSFNGNPQSAMGALATSATPTPPPLSPSWGAEDTTAWVVGVAYSDTTITATAFPYANNNAQANSGAALPPRLAVCTTEDGAATLTPGAFSISSSHSHVRFTYAVRPG